MVLICGDPNTLPWEKSLSKISQIFLQCKKMDTPIFIAGCGMGMLAYYCATGYTPMIVVNGNGKGSPLGGFEGISQKQISELKYGDIFLDSITGDYFSYDQVFFNKSSYKKDKKEWIPKGNAGIHLRRSADEYKSAGSFYKKPLIYHPKKDTDSFLYANSMYEQITEIKKIYLQHWLLRGLPVQFKILARNKWDPHPINIKSSVINIIHSNYKILAESKKGPQIAEHENCICVQFELSPKYPDGMKILENFIEKHLRDIYVIFCFTKNKNSVAIQ